MSNTPEHIHPIFDKLLQRSEKEEQLKQRSRVIWLTGMSGSGKSTVAQGLERALHDKGFMTMLLDGDNVRSGINNNLTFSAEDRFENIRRIAEVSKLFLNSGIVTINCFVSPTNDLRRMARDIIGHEDFLLIYVSTPFEVCEQRDVKGLYKKARAGEIKNFTGLDAPFDKPDFPYIEIDTTEQSPEESVKYLLEQVLPHIEFK